MNDDVSKIIDALIAHANRQVAMEGKKPDCSGEVSSYWSGYRRGLQDLKMEIAESNRT